MKVQILTLCISALLLSACGGGGGSSSTESTSPSPSPENPQQPTPPKPNTTLQQWHLIDLEDRPTASSWLREFELYRNVLSFSDGKFYTLEDGDSMYFTADAVYQVNDLPKAKYGYEYGSGAITDEAMTIRLRSTLGKEKLELTNYVKKIDISGNDLLPRLQPELNWQLNHLSLDELQRTISVQDLNTLQALQKLKFPQGSVCLQKQASANNQAYIVVDIEPKQEQQGFLDYAKQYGTDPNILKFTYMNSISYINKDNRNWGYTEYQNRYYWSEYNEKGIEYSVVDDLEQKRQQVQQLDLSAAEKAARLARIDHIAEGCTYYNKTAADYIFTHVNY